MRNLRLQAVVLFLVLADIAAWCAGAWAGLPVPNSSFETGGDSPDAWQHSGGVGEWLAEGGEGARSIAVTGTGNTGDTNYWRSETLPLEPFSLYEVRFQARRLDGVGGCPISGPVFCNRDLAELGPDWQTYRSIFLTPSNLSPDIAWLRFGQWEVQGTVAYDDIHLYRVQPIYRSRGDLSLGTGERVNGTHYQFQAPLNSASRNHSRPIERLTCYFNTGRLVFGGGSEVVFRHQAGGIEQTAATIEVNIGHYTRGEVAAEVSTDGAHWIEIGRLGSAGVHRFEAPGSCFPAKSVRVRFRSLAREGLGTDSDFGAAQIYNYQYDATLARAPGDLEGMTSFAAIIEDDPKLRVELEELGDGIPGGGKILRGTAVNLSQESLALEPALRILPEEGDDTVVTGLGHTLAAGERLPFWVPYSLMGSGKTKLAFTMGEAAAFLAEVEFNIHPLHDIGYGEVLPASTGSVGLWWASSGWKVSQSRPLPEKSGAAIRIATARNEADAAQLVLRPSEPLRNFMAVCGALSGPEGAVIPEEHIEVLRVRYVPVSIPTDESSIAGPWPDPLPPFQGPIDLDAEKNQPLWVRVKPPKGIPGGLYTGIIRLEADDYKAEARIEVEVFDFDLPDRMRCETAFGFDHGLVFLYHGLSDPDQRRMVYEQYLKILSGHHITPYNPAALDPFRVTWPGLEDWQGGLRDTNEKHSGQSSLYLHDDSEVQNVSAGHQKPNAIPEGGLQIGFWCKTGSPGQLFQVTLRHYDAGDQWLRGNNNDIRIQGNGEWTHFETLVDRFPENAAYFRLSFWPVPFSETGDVTGAAWFDDLVVTDLRTDQTLLETGFEPLDAQALTPEIDWSAWDVAMDKAFNHYHFNSVSIPIVGMGGGTFHSRTEPSLLGYSEDTPEYQAAFSAYCRAVEAHLIEKGWIDDTYVYWFDEPDPKDYEFVMNGFRKLKEHAPRIRRMLTEQIEPELVGGPNLWCPLTPDYDHDLALERRADGDQFWWYICTGPKAPYVTLFIDHPGTELRVWGWQTWERRIDGLLIWQTNYWTSDPAYPPPGPPQNPYEDPMGWVSGYSTPSGTKMAWGNGDGRFIYPPEAAADGQPAAPVLDPPVGSIRLDMLRDGIEDYEYLAMLEELLKKHGNKLSEAKRAEYAALVEPPKSVTVSLTQFTLDPAPIEAHRYAVARAIEDLLRK